ncbi:MAG: hypothetical protein HY859_06920 [Caulobacterales bacterium]|nr:hypothetical protein [Caulobacterales bacterium]
MPKPEGTGQRRPTEEDMPRFMELVSEGKSLREACRKLELHAPSTHTFIDSDDGLREQYARAKEQRAEHYQEDVLTVTKAAALGLKVNGQKVDAAGARAYLEATKWATARMAPKTAPVQRLDLTSRTRQMTDAEIAEEIAAFEAGARGDG